MKRPTFWVEICAGSAATTLGLIGGPRCKPPVSYMGSKTGYRKAILAAMGLRQGLGADRVVLVEAGPWADVWSCLIDPEKCKAVADIIRGWIGEDARALWDRLRAEAVPTDTALGVARWLCLQGGSFNNYPIEIKPPTPDYNRWPGGNHPGTWPADIKDRTSEMAAGCWPPTAIFKGDAAAVEPVPPLPEGTFVYMDPPYQNTTGYAHDLPREAVLEIARKWSDAGAVVCVSEAEPLPLPGWHHVEITGARIGQARTFSRQKQEWLTMSRPPVVKPTVQQSLFGGTQ